jgi:putative peptidoglycan lipid II flippase
MVQAYRLIGFQLTGQLCGVGVDVVNNTMGSMLGAGNVTALRLATRIIDSFGGLLPASVVFAAMPAVATSVANRDMPATKKHLQRAIYLLLLVSLPLSVWLAVVHRPLIAFLYERASFSVNDTIMVSNLLLIMIPYLFLGRFHGLMELPFFADQDTRTPLIASVVAAVAYVAGSLLLISHLGIFALPVGRILSSISGPCFLGYLLRRRIGSLGLRAIRSSAWKVVGASLVMVAFTFIGSLAAPLIPVPSLATKVFALGFPTAVGFVAMIISFFMLGIMDSTILDVYLPNRRQWLTRFGVTAE